MNPLIDIQAVTKAFKKGNLTITPLENLSLKVQTGEFLSLMAQEVQNVDSMDELIPPHTVRGLRFSVARVRVWDSSTILASFDYTSIL